MQKLFTIEDFSVLSYICGHQDRNIKLLEEDLGVKIQLASEGFLIKGSKEKVQQATDIMAKLYVLAQEGVALDESEISRYSQGRFNRKSGRLSTDTQASGAEQGIRVPSARRKFVFPKTKGQQQYIEAMREYDIVFSTGPAGTGKTYLAMAMAVYCLTQKTVRRIILTRPALEAGESLGFLPGDMHDKLGPYLRPLYDALYDMMEAEVIEGYLETGVIEIVPLAYMRGRTLNNAFVILDEAQNCTSEQLRMFLTRLGFDSKTVITGDITQTDLPGGKPTGLIEAMGLLEPIQGIKFIALGKNDVVRHPLIQKIIQAYETYHSKKRH